VCGKKRVFSENGRWKKEGEFKKLGCGKKWVSLRNWGVEKRG
jgi:hypothetical protein